MPIKKVKKVQQEQKTKTFETSGEYAFIPEKLKKFCVTLDKVKLDPKNPRKNDEAAKQVAKLISANGFRKPIVIDQDGIIRAGNTAYKAARILGMKYIPVAESDFEEVEAVIYGISDNKSNDYSEWDDDILKDLIKSHSLDIPEKASSAGLTKKNLHDLFTIKKEFHKEHTKIEIIVTCDNEESMQVLFNELVERGHDCRVLSL